jgi:hypothetical protein
MKIVYSVIVLVLLGPAGSVCAQNQLLAHQLLTPSIFKSYPNLEAQAREFCEAYVRKDYQRMIELTHPKMLECAGGKERLLSELGRGEELWQAYGIEYLSWTPADATQVISDSGSLYAIVPTIVNRRVRGEPSAFDVCLIGISSDEGQHWTFVPTSCVNLSSMFPNVAPRLRVCPGT